MDLVLDVCTRRGSRLPLQRQPCQLNDTGATGSQGKDCSPSPPPPMQFLSQLLRVAYPLPASKQAIGAKYQWGGTLNSLLRLWKFVAAADLPPIWDVSAPLYRDRYQSLMESVWRCTVEHLWFRAPHISHAATVLVWVLTFYSKYLDVMGEAINVFLFLGLFPSTGSKATLMARITHAILGGGALTCFTGTRLLLAK